MNEAKGLLKLLGWKVENKIKDQMPPKAVVLSVPHTSLTDFFIGFFAYRNLGLKAHFLIKKEAFVFPFKKLLYRWGGIPVNRGKKSNIIQDIVNEFNTRDEFLLTITPEGSRSPRPRWKDGYHRIAKAANVPVLIGYIDYKTKSIGIEKIYKLQGDAAYDTVQIMKYYIGMEGRNPEKFVLPKEVYESAEKDNVAKS